MPRVHDWQLSGPYKNLMSLLERNPQVRDCDGANDALRELTEKFDETLNRVNIAVYEHAIREAENEIATARAHLVKLQSSDVDHPF